MESIVRDNIVNHLERFLLIKDSQHRFVRNRSRFTILLAYLKEVTEYLDFGFQLFRKSAINLINSADEVTCGDQSVPDA